MSTPMTFDRALTRLKQMAAEQKLAILKGDAAMLCRIASLLPPAIEALQAKDINKNTSEWKDLQEILNVQQDAEKYLSSRMNDIRERLQHSAEIKKACITYRLKNAEIASNYHDLG